MKTIGLYRSYNFKNKNPIIDRLRTIMQELGWSNQKLSDETGLSNSCIWNIFEGATIDPRHSTCARIAIAFGRADLPLTEVEPRARLRLVSGGRR